MGIGTAIAIGTGAYGLINLLMKALSQSGERGLGKAQIDAQLKAMLAGQAATKSVAKEKRRAYESNIREMKGIMGQRENRAIQERQLATQRQQQSMDAMFINQMIQAMMQKAPTGGQPLMPATSIMQMLGRS